MENFRIGNGFDIHALAPGLPLTIGGVSIEHNLGFVAHSDGDVLIHALCDALLGAAALGDIGVHFPDNDPTYKGIDSKLLLERVVALIESKGFRIGNVDATLLAQRPKLQPHIPAMRQTLAALLHLPVDRVSIKATTTERLGPIGAEQGIAAMASVLLF